MRFRSIPHNTAHFRRLLSGGTLLVTALLLGGCQTLQMKAPRQVASGDWLVDGATNGRERVVNALVTPPLEEMWLYNANAGFGAGSPLLFKDVIIVANRKGELHGVEIDTGNSIGVKNLGEAVEGSLLIRNGIIYAMHAWGKYSISAFDLTRGTMVWREKGIPYETAPVAVGGALIAVDVEGNVRSFDIQSGDSLWVRPIGEDIIAKASPLVLDDGNLFVVSEKGLGFLLKSSDGSEVWKSDLGVPVYASPTKNGSDILIPTTRGRVYSISSSDAAQNWVFEDGNDMVKFSSASTDGAVVFVGTSSGTLYALDANSGQVQWQLNVPDAITAAPLITDSHVYFGTMGRMLYAIDRFSGEMLWESKLKGRIKSAMAAREGELIVITEPRYIYGFREEVVDAESL